MSLPTRIPDLYEDYIQLQPNVSPLIHALCQSLSSSMLAHVSRTLEVAKRGDPRETLIAAQRAGLGKGPVEVDWENILAGLQEVLKVVGEGDGTLNSPRYLYQGLAPQNQPQLAPQGSFGGNEPFSGPSEPKVTPLTDNYPRDYARPDTHASPPFIPNTQSYNPYSLRPENTFNPRTTSDVYSDPQNRNNQEPKPRMMGDAATIESPIRPRQVGQSGHIEPFTISHHSHDENARPQDNPYSMGQSPQSHLTPNTPSYAHPSANSRAPSGTQKPQNNQLQVGQPQQPPQPPIRNSQNIATPTKPPLVQVPPLNRVTSASMALNPSTQQKGIVNKNQITVPPNLAWQPGRKNNSLMPRGSLVRGSIVTPGDQLTNLLKKLREKYSNFVKESIAISSKPYRIESSRNNSRIYYGGESFGYLEKAHGWFRDEGVIWEKAVTAIKDIGKGRIAVAFAKDNSMGVYSEMFTSAGYLKGEAYNRDGIKLIPRSRGADDNNHLVWLKGNSCLCIVALNQMTVSEYPDFFIDPTSQNLSIPIPLAAVLTTDGQNVYALSQSPDSNTLQYLHIMNQQSIDLFALTNYLPIPSLFTSLELSFEGDALFIGGADCKGRAVLLALGTAEKDRKLWHKWERETAFEGVKSIRRHPECNILFLGMKRHVVILYWAESKVLLINQIGLGQPVSPGVMDMTFCNGGLWLVNETREITVIQFDQEVLKDRELNKVVLPTKKDKLNIDEYYQISEQAEPLVPKTPLPVSTNRDGFAEENPNADLSRAHDQSRNPNTTNMSASQRNPTTNTPSATMRDGNSTSKTLPPRRYPKYADLFSNYLTKTYNLPDSSISLTKLRVSEYRPQRIF